MEFIQIVDQNSHVSGIVLNGDMVVVVGAPHYQAAYTFKEFDRFVAAYRKARREAAATD